jgi:group I intron endonuclease
MIVYKTINIVNNKIYVGQDSKNNQKYLGSGTIFLNAVKKYGKENFIKETLCFCSNQEDLDFQETYWIEKLNSCDKTIGYNILKKGRSPLGFKHSDESKLKISLFHKNKKKSDSHKKNLSIAKTGIVKGPHTELTKIKIGLGNKGKIVSDETKQRLSIINTGSNHPKFGTHHSEETKQKIGLGRKGKKNSIESIKMMRAKNSKKIEIELIKYNSIKEASVILKKSQTTIIRHLKDVNNLTYKYL